MGDPEAHFSVSWRTEVEREFPLPSLAVASTNIIAIHQVLAAV